MISLFFFIAVLLSCATVVLWKRDIDIIKCGALGISFYFIGYIFSTAALFFVEQFSLKRATFGALCIFIGVFTFSFYKTYCNGQIQLTIALRESGISYLIIFILLVTFVGSFGFFGMGQDQGVYQTEAINMINGQNKWRTTIDEYKTIEDEEYKEYYRESVRKVLGYKFVEDTYSDVLTQKDTDALEGIYHGLPTFPAVLALAGSMFGIEHMMFFQTAFYVISLLLIEYILQKQNIIWWMRGLLVTIFGISPEVVWISKSSLTEGFMAVLILLYLFFLMGDDCEIHSLSILPVISICFWHLSAFSMFPLFIVNYWFLFFVYKNTKYLKVAAISILGLILSVIVNFQISTIYVVDNFSKLLLQRGVYLPRTWVIAIVIVLSLIGIVINEGARFFKNIKFNSIIKIENVLTIIIIVATIVDFIYGEAYWGILNFPTLIGKATITAYTTLTGFFLLPIILVLLFLFIKKSKNNYYYIVLNGFLYAVLFYSLVLRRRVLYYYYNSRYIMPYTVLIVLLFGVLYTYLDFKSNIFGRIKKSMLVLMLVIGIWMMIPFSCVVKDNQDDTNLQWNTVVALMNRVKSGDVVYLEEEGMMPLYHIFRAKGAYVYPVMGDIYDSIEKSRIISNGRNIFFLSESESYEGEGRFGVVYKDKSQYQLDDMESVRKIIFWPTDFTVKGEKNYILYKLYDEEPTVFGSDGCFISGWTENSSGYRWMNDNVSSFFTHLEKDNYKMHVIFGNIIPFGMIGTDEITVEVYINDSYLRDVDIIADMQDFEIEIPEKYVNEGRNIITFETNDRWSPSEYGSQDPSEYAFSVDKISFSKIK